MKVMASLLRRSWSGLATPPGSITSEAGEPFQISVTCKA